MTKEEAQAKCAEAFDVIVEICNKTGMVETGKNLTGLKVFLLRAIRMYWPEEQGELP